MLIIVRHGRTTANALGLLQGRVDNQLDDEGRQQADAIARAIGPVSAVLASPLRRAQETAAAFGMPIETVPGWIELDYGEWDERPVRDVSAASWAQWRADPHFRPPGGESLAELADRVEASARELVERAADADIVVVTHVSPIKAVVAWALGVGPEVSWRTNVAQASITRIRTAGPLPALISFNETHHLPTTL